MVAWPMPQAECPLGLGCRHGRCTARRGTHDRSARSALEGRAFLWLLPTRLPCHSTQASQQALPDSLSVFRLAGTGGRQTLLSSDEAHILRPRSAFTRRLSWGPAGSGAFCIRGSAEDTATRAEQDPLRPVLSQHLHVSSVRFPPLESARAENGGRQVYPLNKPEAPGGEGSTHQEGSQERQTVMEAGVACTEKAPARHGSHHGDRRARETLRKPPSSLSHVPLLPF